MNKADSHVILGFVTLALHFWYKNFVLRKIDKNWEILESVMLYKRQKKNNSKIKNTHFDSLTSVFFICAQINSKAANVHMACFKYIISYPGQLGVY